MSTVSLSRPDELELFAHQDTPGTFRLLAVETAGLNYLDGLNRKRLDPLCTVAERTQAARRLVELEGKLYRHIQKETPISYFDADFRAATQMYILVRQIFLKATSFTFKRHRFTLLLQLLKLYGDDPCSILPERDIMIARLEQDLFEHYLLLDMGQKNTEACSRDLGRSTRTLGSSAPSTRVSSPLSIAAARALSIATESSSGVITI